jgi:hypothetical protein
MRSKFSKKELLTESTYFTTTWQGCLCFKRYISLKIRVLEFYSISFVQGRSYANSKED